MAPIPNVPKARSPAVVVVLRNCTRRGINLPRDFVTGFDLSFNTSDINGTGWQGIDAADVEACRHPDNEGYWDAWRTILDRAFYTDEFGDVYRLHFDYELFAYCPERMTDEEKRNFFNQ